MYWPGDGGGGGGLSRSDCYGERIWLSRVGPGFKGGGDPELEAKLLGFFL